MTGRTGQSKVNLARPALRLLGGSPPASGRKPPCSLPPPKTRRGSLRASFYSLRHASVTRMLTAGVPIQAVAATAEPAPLSESPLRRKFVPADRARSAALGALTRDI